MGGLIKRLEKPFINNPEKQRDLSNKIPTSTHKEGDTQTVGVIGIDPEKLMSKLELKFPSAFRVHMMHNNYIIQAPEALSQTDLDECR